MYVLIPFATVISETSNILRHGGHFLIFKTDLALPLPSSPNCSPSMSLPFRADQ